MTFDEVVARLKAKRTGDAWLARCPNHDDRTAPLSLREGEDGRTLLHCHAGCAFDAVVQAAGLTLKDLFPARRPPGRHQKIAATYDYRAEDGKLLYQQVRFEPKDFRQRRPDGQGHADEIHCERSTSRGAAPAR